MQAEELEEVITAHYPQFLGSLLLRFGTANQNQPKIVEIPPASPPPANSKAKAAKPATTSIIPSQQIVQAFKNFLECGKDEQVHTHFNLKYFVSLVLIFHRFKRLLTIQCGNN